MNPNEIKFQNDNDWNKSISIIVTIHSTKHKDW